LSRGNLFRKICRHKNRGGARLAQLRRVLWVVEKGNFPVGGVDQRCSASDLLCRITEQLAVAHRCEFLKSERHCFL